jgi:hypothetical protein
MVDLLHLLYLALTRGVGMQAVVGIWGLQVDVCRGLRNWRSKAKNPMSPCVETPPRARVAQQGC